jgi:hypothetical protein
MTTSRDQAISQDLCIIGVFSCKVLYSTAAGLYVLYTAAGLYKAA